MSEKCGNSKREERRRKRREERKMVIRNVIIERERNRGEMSGRR